jgi:GNAT superfamily N-acetyltransferase
MKGSSGNQMAAESSRSLVPQLLTGPAVVLIVRPRNDLNGTVLAELVVQRFEVDPFEGRGGSDDRKLTLSYLVVGGSNLSSGVLKGDFRASYDSGMKIVSLTSHVLYGGALDLTLPGLEGHGIGTYLMNTIVWWAKQFPSDTAVNTITLRPGQAIGHNKARRNRFYEQFGIEFDYADPVTQETGESRSMSVSGLNPREKWSYNVVEENIAEYMRQRNVTCEKAETRVRYAEEEVGRLRSTLKEERARLEQRYRHSIRRMVVRFVALTAVACAAVGLVTAKIFS